MTAIISARDKSGKSIQWKCSSCGEIYDDVEECNIHGRTCFGTPAKIRELSLREKRMQMLIGKTLEYFKDDEEAELRRLAKNPNIHKIARKAIEIALISKVKKNGNKR